MADDAPAPVSTPPYWQLRRADQLVAAATAALVLVFLLGGSFYRFSQGRPDIEIDEADKLTARFEVDINTASVPELMQVPNVGRTLARRIVEMRETSGPFRHCDDLRQVRGIGPKTYEKIRPYLIPISASAARPSEEEQGARTAQDVSDSTMQ